MSWCSGLDAICRPDVPLHAHTWYGLGGPARWFVTPHSEDELAEVLRRCAANGIAWRVLGRGANLLISDAGFDGAVLNLIGDAWDWISFDGPRVRAGGGADFTRVVRDSVEQGLTGLEGLAGIPGSVGGVVRMNAGGRYGCVADRLVSARLMQPDGTADTHPASALGLSYRTSRLNGAIVLAAEFALTPADRDATLGRFREVWTQKAAEQPPVAARSAGCIFKNPPGHAAGKLLDDAELKGTRCGQAEISRRHANFILAYDGATSSDVLNLIRQAQARVRAATGVELELEVEVW